MTGREKLIVGVVFLPLLLGLLAYVWLLETELGLADIDWAWTAGLVLVLSIWSWWNQKFKRS